MRRMQRLTMGWWLMAACGPEAPQGGSTAMDSGQTTQAFTAPVEDDRER